MGQFPLPAIDRAEIYANSRGLSIVKQLGGGFDGIVYKTNQSTAIKALNKHLLYQQELAVYLRLREKNVRNVKGFQVPSLIDYDDGLAVIEMSVVMPPYVLDFAGARLDHRGPFSEEQIAEWKAEKQEQFESDWPAVKSMLWAFEAIGIYLNDVHPRNVSCR